MSPSFRLLKAAVVLFKVIAWFVLIVMAVGIVALLMGSDAQTPLPVPVVLNMVFSGLVGFLLFFSLGEVVRILLTIEANTRKT